MQCDYFDAHRCRSCTLMGVPYADQLAAKDAAVRSTLAGRVPAGAWRAPYANDESGFRNKAKLAVGGTVDAPTLGILDRQGAGVDLRECGLHEAGLRELLGPLAAFVTAASLPPYDLATRRGELKNLLLTRSPDGEVMLRFVLRSQESVARIRKHLPRLLAQHPQITVASANILPEHKAVLEGDLEIPLTDTESLPMQVNDITLHLRALSFFQTSTRVAAALYAQAREWCREVAATTVWDLYSGVGGFALHLAEPGRRIVGVESSAEAVASARLSAEGLPGELQFVAGDAAAYAVAHPAPDLVVVNPPRRGIGELADWLERSTARSVLYSSCNAESLARDLARMPSWQAKHARLFDMFPQTDHHEVMVLLRRSQ